ncbi:MAG: ROK family glucokinase [Eubacterium sp.]|nr:ROK family glucokinase [Eubacterium sp.]
MKAYAAGIDVGGTTVKMGLFKTDGTVVEKWEVRTVTDNGGERILPDIAESLKKKLAEKKIGLDELEGVGIGVPGAVLADGTVNKCINLGWGVKPVGRELSGLLDGIRVEVGNDANVAALGEMWKGGGMGYKNIVMVTLGTGVGGGIIIDGRIIPGAFGAGGEIGHMCMNTEETESCNCGKKGCLEQYVSATGISRMAGKAVKEYEGWSVLKQHEKNSAKAVFDAAKEGDELALQIVDQFGRILGRALALISGVVDPEAFVIGGGVSRAGQIIIDAVQKYYKEYAFHASRSTDFRLATLENDAGIYGAVAMVL